MAVTAYLRWLCLWWGLLLCTLPVAQAATRQHVTMPSNLTATTTGVATKGQGVLHVGVSQGEYIAANRMNRKVPIKVLKTIDYSIPRTINQAKGLLKANLGQVLLGGVIAGAVGAVGWVMSDDNTKIRKKVSEGSPIPVDQYGWLMIDGPSCVGQKFPSPEAAYPCITDFYTSYLGPGYQIERGSIVELEPGHKQVRLKVTYLPNGIVNTVSYSGRLVVQGHCPAPGYIAGDQCVSGEPQYVDVTADEIDTTFGNFATAQDADWLNSLLRESCAGSISPEACMQSLRDSVSTSGPDTVPGESTTTTGTYTRPDGTTGTTQTTSNTTYNIKYGPTYFDWTENKTVIHHKDGQKTGEETTTEGDEPVDEQSPEDDEQATPMPCGGDCEGPAYKDLYEPTSETRESIIDDYMARARAAPILAAVGGFFDVSGNAACPIWSQHVYADMGFTALDWTLTFDFFCTELALGLYPWASSVLCLVAAWVAFRWGILE